MLPKQEQISRAPPCVEATYLHHVQNKGIGGNTVELVRQASQERGKRLVLHRNVAEFRKLAGKRKCRIQTPPLAMQHVAVEGRHVHIGCLPHCCNPFPEHLHTE